LSRPIPNSFARSFATIKLFRDRLSAVAFWALDFSTAAMPRSSATLALSANSFALSAIPCPTTTLFRDRLSAVALSASAAMTRASASFTLFRDRLSAADFSASAVLARSSAAFALFAHAFARSSATLCFCSSTVDTCLEAFSPLSANNDGLDMRSIDIRGDDIGGVDTRGEDIRARRCDGALGCAVAS